MLRYYILIVFVCSVSLRAQSTREVEDNTPVDEKRQQQLERRYKPNSKITTYRRLSSLERLEREYHKRIRRLARVYGKYGVANPRRWDRYVQNFGHRRKPRIRHKKRRRLCKQCGIVH